MDGSYFKTILIYVSSQHRVLITHIQEGQALAIYSNVEGNPSPGTLLGSTQEENLLLLWIEELLI